VMRATKNLKKVKRCFRVFLVSSLSRLSLSLSLSLSLQNHLL